MRRVNLLEALSDNIRIDRGKCVACGKCVDTCVLDNLRLNLSPCRAACPLGVNCQGYIQLITRGEEEKAMKLLAETLPFPAILGRVCAAPCEKACHRGKTTGEAVSIRALKRYLTESVDPAALPSPAAAAPTGKSAAIVGSGPAGLIAALDLALAGHAVTVYEAEAEPGGMLRWSIPEFNLPNEIVVGEIDRLRRLGVTFKCGVRIGEGKNLDELKSNFNAVIVAAGCMSHARLGIPGEDLPSVRHGLPFLISVRKGERPELSGRTIVIGGGNVAVDAARTSLRLGSSEVRMVALESAAEMPASRESAEAAKAEGILIDHGWGPLGIVPGGSGGIRLELQRCTSVFDGDARAGGGRFSPRFDSCETRVLDADHLVIAIGQRRDASCMGESLHAAPDPLTLATSDPAVFMAGDFVSGPSTIIEAMASGRRAAESVNRLLHGEDLRHGREYRGPVELEFEIDVSRGSDGKRVREQRREYAGFGDFHETALPLNREAARLEAHRCYSCGVPFGKFRTCWFCLPCEVECPEQALRVEIPYLAR